MHLGTRWAGRALSKHSTQLEVQAMDSGPDAIDFSGNGVWDVREGKPLSEYVTGEERLLGDLHQQGHYTCREVWELRPRNSVEANWRAFLYQTNAPAHV